MADSSPTFTAELLDIKPLTLRRWCEYHAEHLSPGTNPPSGQARRFTDKDIEVLKHIKHLRSQGFNTAIINERLAGLTFAEVITVERSEDDSADSEDLATQNAPESLQQAPQSFVVALQHIERRMDAYERRRLDTVTSIGLGFVGGLLFCAILILLAWLYGG